MATPQLFIVGPLTHTGSSCRRFRLHYCRQCGRAI